MSADQTTLTLSLRSFKTFKRQKALYSALRGFTGTVIEEMSNSLLADNSNLNFDAYLEAVKERYSAVRSAGAELRFGQFLFNEMATDRPHVTNKLRATKNDPFYHEEVPASVLKAIAEIWDENPA